MITAYSPTPTVTLASQTAMAAALSDFERRYPAFSSTAILDDLRARDYARLDATGHIYARWSAADHVQ